MLTRLMDPSVRVEDQRLENPRYLLEFGFIRSTLTAFNASTAHRGYFDLSFAYSSSKNSLKKVGLQSSMIACRALPIKSRRWCTLCRVTLNT